MGRKELGSAVRAAGQRSPRSRGGHGTVPQRRPLGMLRRGGGEAWPVSPRGASPGPRGERRGVAEGDRAGRSGASGAAGHPPSPGPAWPLPLDGSMSPPRDPPPGPGHPPSSLLPTAREAGRRGKELKRQKLVFSFARVLLKSRMKR